MTGGRGDLRGLIFSLLLLLALAQAARGQVLAPAASLLWYAFDLVRFARPSPRGRTPGATDESRIAGSCQP